ncbi:MAG: RHS repeat domain-containing protein [Aureispira sp.]
MFNNNYTGLPEESYAGWDISTKLYASNTNPFVSGRRLLGRKEYDLTDHLGNVTTQLSDRKTGTLFTNDIQAQVLSYQQYFPFGWNMPGRSVNAERARFGFNGKEDDEEWSKVVFEFRTYDSRTNRFLSIDPMTSSSPWESPYAFAANSPVVNIDYLGLSAQNTNNSDPPDDAKVIRRPTGTAETGAFKYTVVGSNVEASRDRRGSKTLTAGGKTYNARFSSDPNNDYKTTFIGYFDSEGNQYKEKTLLFEYKMSANFKNKLLQVSYGLGHDPNKLVAVMRQENGAKFPSASQWDLGTGTRAVGLIQFTQAAINQMNKVYQTDYTKTGLSQMTEVEQLDVVKQYYQMYNHKDFSTLSDYALATFAPAYMGSPPNTGLYTKAQSGKKYSANVALDTDGNGIITAGEIGAKYRKYYKKSHQKK